MEKARKAERKAAKKVLKKAGHERPADIEIQAEPPSTNDDEAPFDSSCNKGLPFRRQQAPQRQMRKAP